MRCTGQETHPERQGGSRAEDVDPVGRGQAHGPQEGRVRLRDLVRPLRLGPRDPGPLDRGFQLGRGPGHLQQASFSVFADTGAGSHCA